MTRFVALWRGINLGAAKRVAMADLQAAVAAAGGSGVRTVLASGNAVFDAAVTPARSATLADAIRAAVKKRSGVDARVTLVGAAEFAAAFAEDPFAGEVTDLSRAHLGFAADAPTLARVKALTTREWAPERLAVTRRTVHLWCPNGLSGGALGEAVYAAAGDTVTLRNRATAAKIVALLGPQR